MCDLWRPKKVWKWESSGWAYVESDHCVSASCFCYTHFRCMIYSGTLANSLLSSFPPLLPLLRLRLSFITFSSLSFPTKRFLRFSQSSLISPVPLHSDLFLNIKDCLKSVCCDSMDLWLVLKPLWYSGQSSWLHNGDVLRFLWGTNWIYICYVEERRPSLWSSGQRSWLQIRRPGFGSRQYQ
jgi:hypothetical protein